MIKEYVLGSTLLDIFGIGDMVSWRPLGAKEKQYGIISDIVKHMISKKENRFIMMAKVQSSSGRLYNLLLACLIMESKVKKC